MIGIDNVEIDKFKLVFPGFWISGKDRELASEALNILELVNDLFLEVIVSFTLFDPISKKTEAKKVKYYRYYGTTINNIFSKSFVICLNNIQKLLEKIPPNIRSTVFRKYFVEYKKNFSYLVHIRDSIVHIEDRGLGLDNNKKIIESHFLVLGCYLNGNVYTFSGKDGKVYEVDISEKTVMLAKDILQNIINSFEWE
jgi:hypothetical protein